jgi:hypothetical protein
LRFLPQRPTPVLAPIYPMAMPAAIVSHAGPGEPRRASLSGAVVRGLGLGRQRQLCVGGGITDITIVADETDPAVAPLEPHYVCSSASDRRGLRRRQGKPQRSPAKCASGLNDRPRRWADSAHRPRRLEVGSRIELMNGPVGRSQPAAQFTGDRRQQPDGNAR